MTNNHRQKQNKIRKIRTKRARISLKPPTLGKTLKHEKQNKKTTKAIYKPPVKDKERTANNSGTKQEKYALRELGYP